MLHNDKAAAVGLIPSGLFIVAVKDQNNQTSDGYLASWVQQVSFSPMLVSLAIKPGRPAYDLIKAGKPFAINVVGEHDKSFLKHFWKGYDPAQNQGLILDQAKAAIECVMVSSSRPGDHEIIIAEVKSSHILNTEAKPMVHLRKSGADY